MDGKILLMGKPGVGKTTLIRRIFQRISVRAGGFYTREIRDGRVRTGFQLVTLDGREAILASTRTSAGHPRVGRYTVHVDVLEQLAVPALEDALAQSELIVIDELGKMEMCSVRFRQTVMTCLLSPKPLLATIGVSADPSIRAIRCRPEVTTVEVTLANRDRLVDEMVTMLMSRKNP
jgi:nucleoside-triphosphatase